MKKEHSHIELDTFLAKWLAGELTDKELKRLVSEDDYSAFLKLRQSLEIKEQLDASVEDSYSILSKRIENQKQKNKPSYKNWAIGIAASIVILFGLFTFMNNNEIVIETGFGENKTITLLDGSEVILNSKSKVSYNESNWEEDRKLYLEGEAYFKVAKGKQFTVSTDNGSVKVLGTEFNVNSTKGFFDVVCYEGKVGVKTLKSDYVLLPNDAVRKVGTNIALKSKISGKMPTWIHGESSFKSVPLRYVINALEDEYQIRFDSNSIDNSEIFTGSFPHDSLNIALKTVFETLNITYKEKEKRNIKLRYKE